MSCSESAFRSFVQQETLENDSRVHAMVLDEAVTEEIREGGVDAWLHNGTWKARSTRS